MQPKTISTAITDAVRVTVQSRYLPEQSSPAQQQYAFAYTVGIENLGPISVHLRSRHWIIENAEGKREEVRGPGVVGAQPVIEPGERFQYTSGAMLRTPRGTMRGSYRMQRPDGSHFEAEIARFSLEQPHSLN